VFAGLRARHTGDGGQCARHAARGCAAGPCGWGWLGGSSKGSACGAGGRLLEGIERVKVDGIYIGPRMAQAAQDHKVDVQVTTRDANVKGFKPLPLRWRIEATFGTLSNRYHRLTRNLEQSPAAAEDAVSIANCHGLLRAYHRLEYVGS